MSEQSSFRSHGCSTRYLLLSLSVGFFLGGKMTCALSLVTPGRVKDLQLFLKSPRCKILAVGIDL